MGDLETLIEKKDIGKYIKSHFDNEKQMCDFIELNIHEFCINVFDTQLITYKREYRIRNGTRVGARIDFFLETNKGNFIVECKNTKSFNDLMGSIGQCLGYDCLAKNSEIEARVVLVTSEYHGIIDVIVKQNKLPIDVYIFNKEFSLRLL